MADRIDLQTKLEETLGSKNVYYQPPASIKIHYPAIIYHRTGIEKRYADNKSYLHGNKYTISVIDVNPESPFPDIISEFDFCSFVRAYTDNGLNYWIFELYF